MKISDNFAAKIVARHFKSATFARHQGINIHIRLSRCLLRDGPDGDERDQH
jgi:hypothetical protein